MGHAIRSLTGFGQEVQRGWAPESRSGMRFPVQPPVQVLSGGQHCMAETENFSSSGVLIRSPNPLPANSEIHFLVEIPPAVLGADVSAAIHGEGRVIRSYEENGQLYSAIVIHEYRFQ